MQQTFSSHSFDNTVMDVSVLTVAIFYEDFEAGKHAKRTYDYLADTLGGEIKFANTMWKFDVLGIPKLRELAAKDAAMADIVIVASHGGPNLPPQMQLWADQWLVCRRNTAALVCLCDCSDEQANGVRAYLESLAMRGNVEYFAQPQELRTNKRMPARTENHPPHTGRTLDTLSGAMRREVGIPRWGINE